jgi:hypothetical protein
MDIKGLFAYLGLVGYIRNAGFPIAFLKEELGGRGYDFLTPI